MEKVEIETALIFKKARIDREMSLQDVADLIGKSRYTVRDYEEGRTRIFFSVFLDLCNALGLDVNTVVKKAEEAANQSYVKGDK